MLNKRLDIADDHAEIFRRTAFTRRMAVPARVPGEYRDILEAERLDCFLPSRGMFVAAMEQEECFVGRVGGKP